jgi:hypothetical protein
VAPVAPVAPAEARAIVSVAGWLVVELSLLSKTTLTEPLPVIMKPLLVVDVAHVGVHQVGLMLVSLAKIALGTGDSALAMMGDLAEIPPHLSHLRFESFTWRRLPPVRV